MSISFFRITPLPCRYHSLLHPRASTQSEHLVLLLVKPLSTDPSVQHIEGSLRLVHWDHVSGAENAHEGKVTRGLDSSGLLLLQLQILSLGLLVVLGSRPLKRISPSTVTEPVADEVRISGVDEHWDLVKDLWHEAVERHHPIALEQEVTVDIKIARIVRRNLDTKGFHNVLLVQVLRSPSKSRIAEVAIILALSTDIVDVLASTLIWTNHSVVTVDRRWDAGPNGLGLVALLDQRLAAWKRVVHGLALGLGENSWVATVAAGHWAVVLVLDETIGEAVADEDRLKVDVALFVGKNLRGEDWNVVASIRLSSDVEVLLSVLWELLKEQRQESIDVLAGCDGVGD